MEKFQPHTLDNVFDKLFEEMYTGTGARGQDMNTRQHCSMLHPVEQKTKPAYTMQAETVSHNAVNNTDISCHAAPSYKNDLVLSSCRRRTIKHKTSEVTEVTKHRMSEASFSRDRIGKNQSIEAETADKIIDSSEKRLLGKNVSDRNTHENEKLKLGSDTFEYQNRDDKATNNHDIHVNSGSSSAYYASFPYQYLQLTGTDSSNDYRHSENFDPLSKQTVTQNSMCNWFDGPQNENLSKLELSCDMVNLSASSANSSVYIESAVDQLFEETLKLNQHRQNGVTFYNQASENIGNRDEMTDLKPSTRRSHFATRSDEDTHHLDMNRDMLVNQKRADSNVINIPTVNPNCTVQEYQCSADKESVILPVPEQSLTDLQPSCRRRSTVCHKSTNKGTFQLKTNGIEEEVSSNNINRINKCRNGLSSKSCDTDVGTERISDIGNGEATEDRKEKKDILKKQVHSKDRVKDIKRNSHTQRRKKNIDYAINNEDVQKAAGKKETESVKSVNSSCKNKTSDKPTKQIHVLDNILGKAANYIDESSTPKCNGSHLYKCQSQERNSRVSENKCDLKKGTKRKRHVSVPDCTTEQHSKVLKCKVPVLKDGSGSNARSGLSSTNSKKKSLVKTHNKAKNKKHFEGFPNGQTIINKIHKTIAESSDLSSKVSHDEYTVVDELDGVKISELENFIPLEVLTCKHSRKARMRLEKQKGALHRQVSKDGIWRSVNSKY